MYKKWNTRRVSLWIVFLMQIILVVLYFLTQNENSTTLTQRNLKNPITFISTSSKNVTKFSSKYYTENNRIILRSKFVADVYEDFNTSLCYKYGTDIKLMKRSKDVKWRCVCLPGWHGNDCGQPEVIWRALLTSKRTTPLNSPRKVQRRIIYFIEIEKIYMEFIEITIYELQDTIDLFVLFDSNRESSNMKGGKLQSGFLKDVFSKILYIGGANKNEAWSKCKKIIKNLREDDIFFINNQFEIPNVKALQFLKLYNDWPEPVIFRLRWSVYGFFWKHPLRTILSSGACTVHYLLEALDDNLDVLKHKFISSNNLKEKPGFIIGDLNHFGGWFCEFCSEPSSIINMLKMRSAESSAILENLQEKKIDTAYIEDLIENGLYLDGKTELERAHRSHEHYYAPIFVVNNTWKYDWLLINLYSKLDYY